MVPITGYSDRMSARPGETIAFKISSSCASPYRASLIRIISGDPNPQGPGLKYEAVPSAIEGSYPSRQQEIRLGSYAVVPSAPALRRLGSFTLAFLASPTLLRESPQGLVGNLDGTGRGFRLSISKAGLALELGRAGQAPFRLELSRAVSVGRWYRFFVSLDLEGKEVLLGQRPLKPDFGIEDSGSVRSELPGAPALDSEAPLVMAALGGEPVTGHFNGKLEGPVILGAALGEAASLLDPSTPGLTPLASWDFARGIEGDRIEDTGPQGLEGRLINLPTRGVTGARWDGQEHCWRHAPEDYAAIHFHEDDLYDCGWETDFVFTVPKEMPSGVYGVKLACEDAEDILPFYVLPPRGRAAHPILFLASTFTYQAYANHARGNHDAAWRARAKEWGASPWHPDAHPDYGRSTYNKHSDGSGICYSSRLRPVLTMRPGFVTFVDARGSGLRHFPADTHLLSWLEAKGLAFDVATDEDLDEEGPELLHPYEVVLTGSHPEYHTKGTLDALEGYVAEGGRLVYLGGNGFYWRIARSRSQPGVIEVRRAEGGIRAWPAEPGEYYQSFDGQYGGLWRRNGRPPQRLAGVGFTAQGLFEGSYYRRLPLSEDPRYAWIFEGIAEEKLGDFGLSGGGAAGFELDRLDYLLGSPLNAVVLARSEAHQAHFIVVPEELLSHIATVTGEKPEALVRAELVYFDAPKGGAVFSVGSITFCGSLPHNDYDNNISRLLENVVRRFAGL